MSDQTLSLKQHQIFIGDFLALYSKYEHTSLQKGITIKSKRNIKHPFSYTIQLAKIEDAEDITLIIKDVYRGTYPYKELEDVDEIKRMIEDPDFTWVIFKKESGENIACGGYHVDLESRSGTFHAFALKREYHGQVNSVDAALALMGAIFRQYKGTILHWSCEVVSNHDKSQHLLKHIGMIPIAFLPKKDVFFAREVSEFVYIIYDKDILKKYRSSKTPNLINRAIFSYFYAQQKFNLEVPNVHGLVTYDLILDEHQLEEARENLVTKIESCRFNKEIITIYNKKTKSYIRFLYRINIKSVEKAEYEVKTNEDLAVFLEHIKKFMKDNHIQYFEAYVSAYDPSHQKIFYSSGFKPTGYIPCYKYDASENSFCDQIIFVSYTGKDLNNVKLVPDTINFLKTIRFYNKIKSLKLEPF
ncbi:MAG: GNAT family N-acetyltransferase [Promethearchaeota archaeon]